MSPSSEESNCEAGGTKIANPAGAMSGGAAAAGPRISSWLSHTIVEVELCLRGARKNGVRRKLLWRAWLGRGGSVAIEAVCQVYEDPL